MIFCASLDWEKVGDHQSSLLWLNNETSQTILHKVKEKFPSLNCILLSTCLRTELWFSNLEENPGLVFCQIFDLKEEDWLSSITIYENRVAVKYLFELCSGLHSALFGEDQIISQVNSALSLSRQLNLCDSVLEKIFQVAVTCAKTVKSKINLQVPDETIASAVFQKIQEFQETNKLKDYKQVVVIGTSAMARLVASYLYQQGFDVTVTIRDLEKAKFLVPQGCQFADYNERFNLVKNCRIVISATLGLNYTLDSNFLSTLDGGRFFGDLALPADIPAEKLPKNCFLVTINTLDCSFPKRAEAVEKAKESISLFENEFWIWFNFRPLSSVIAENARDVSNDAVKRMKKTLDSLNLEENEREEVEERLRNCTRKAFEHQIIQMLKRGDKQGV